MIHCPEMSKDSPKTDIRNYGYSAAAKIITTADTMLEELMTIKR